MQSLRTKLIVAMATLLAIVAIILTAASYERMREEVLDSLRNSADQAAGSAAQRADDWLVSKLQVVSALTVAANQADPVPFLQVSEKAGDYDRTYIAFADKRILFSKPQELPPGYDPTGRPWYQLAANNGKPSITEPYIDAATKKLVITMAAPVGSGQPTAVTAGDVFMDGMVTGVLGVKLKHQGYAFVADKNGQILIHADEARRMKPATELAPGLDGNRLKSLSDSKVLDEISIGGVEKYISVRAIPSTGWYLVVVLDKSDAMAPLTKLLGFSVLAVVILLAVIVPVSATLIAGMLQGLIRIRNAMKDIASGGGDLTHRIEVSGNDEIAQTASAFNQFQEQLRFMFVELQGEASRLTNGVNEISGITRQMAKDSSQLSDHGAANAATIEELSVSIAHIADYAKEANSLVSSTGQLSADGAVSIERLSSEIGRSADAVRELSTLFTEVTHRADGIGGIVQVIKEIADQTNLLALNAAIEAARAGELGRGFAVVADEVRKLAERTSQATQEISDMIGGMRNATASATNNMQRTLESVEAGATLAHETAGNIAQIQSRMTEVVANMSEIAGSTNEQRNAATLMAQNAERVTSQIQQSDTALQTMTHTLGSLDQLATGIRTMFGKFKL